MNVLSGIRVLVLPILLLTSCRSEKVAFQFRPAAPVATVAPAAPTAAARASEPLVSAPVPQLPETPPVAPRRPTSRAMAAAPTRPAHRPLLRRARAEAQSVRAWQAARKPRRATADESDIFHAVLGSLLIIGGVVLGLLVGGWLGLGLGAVVVIAGYYFLVLSFGGPHAWLEIFQEFFNM